MGCLHEIKVQFKELLFDTIDPWDLQHLGFHFSDPVYSSFRKFLEDKIKLNTSKEYKNIRKFIKERISNLTNMEETKETLELTLESTNTSIETSEQPKSNISTQSPSL